MKEVNLTLELYNKSVLFNTKHYKRYLGITFIKQLKYYMNRIAKCSCLKI